MVSMFFGAALVAFAVVTPCPLTAIVGIVGGLLIVDGWRDDSEMIS